MRIQFKKMNRKIRDPRHLWLLLWLKIAKTWLWLPIPSQISLIPRKECPWRLGQRVSLLRKRSLEIASRRCLLDPRMAIWRLGVTIWARRCIRARRVPCRRHPGPPTSNSKKPNQQCSSSNRNLLKKPRPLRGSPWYRARGKGHLRALPGYRIVQQIATNL